MRGKTRLDQKKFTKGQAGGRPLGGSPQPLKKSFPAQPKNDKNPDHGDK
jgi:hypothetical protein